MKPFPLYPLAGIDNKSQRDTDLQVGGDLRRLYVREAVNVDISGGRASMRQGLRQVTEMNFHALWQSPLHQDTFGTIGQWWGRVNTSNWDFEPLAKVGDGPVSHLLLNNKVLVAGSAGIFLFNGHAAQPLAISTPPAPLVRAADGALMAGSYGVAISWLRDGLESSVSTMTNCTIHGHGALEVTLPMCLDESVTHARLYVTRPDGGELGMVEDYPIEQMQILLPVLPGAGAAPKFQHMEAMPTGDYVRHWQGRLVSARTNVLRFSQAMAYHVHDPRHDFVLMPQRITFIEPVDGGIWVGQVDHVAFLAGATPAELSMQRKQVAAPVPGSSIVLPSGVAGELSNGGQAVVAWLANNGYVLGTASGAVLEPQAKRIKGITGQSATLLVLGERLLAAVT